VNESAAAPPKLFVVYLGGAVLPGRMGEDHEVVLVVATDAKAARAKAKRKWRGSGRAHVDAVAEVDAVDGHEIVLRPVDVTGDRMTVDDTYHP
jgi:hypothetical protein